MNVLTVNTNVIFYYSYFKTGYSSNRYVLLYYGSISSIQIYIQILQPSTHRTYSSRILFWLISNLETPSLPYIVLHSIAYAITNFYSKRPTNLSAMLYCYTFDQDTHHIEKCTLINDWNFNRYRQIS